MKMNWNDISNRNDRKQKDEDSIKDYTNDEQKKKQFSLIFDFVRQSTKWFWKRRSHMSERRTNQWRLNPWTRESISSIQKKKQMYSRKNMKEWFVKQKKNDSKQMISSKRDIWEISLKNWKLNINYLYL